MVTQITPSSNETACSFHLPEIIHSSDLIRILEKVSAVGLGVFSMYMSPHLFLPFFAGGVAIGLYQAFQQTRKDPCEHARDTSCSGGFLEQIIGVKMPPIVALGANVGITYCHIDHHTQIFVPIIAVTLGMAVGQLLKTRISPLESINISRCCRLRQAK